MKNNQIAVIIPSYNEVKNLTILINGIKKELPGIKIVVVDDSLALENARIKKLFAKNSSVKLISRLKKSGRGSAVIDGFRMALKDKSTKYLFEMDSDLTHDPVEMKRFIEKVKNKNYDLVIGSRYIKGSKIKNISTNRTIMSRLINFFLYFWLGIHLSDHTSGFRLYSRRAVNFLTKTKINSTGFITLSETAYRIHKKNYVIGEVPITWNFRVYGKSNVNARELFDSLYFVFKLRLTN
jgi:dolichol-phosphate mannosyltransferase